MSEDGGFDKCDSCGLWITGEVHTNVDGEDFCDECWEEEQEEEEGEDEDE